MQTADTPLDTAPRRGEHGLRKADNLRGGSRLGKPNKLTKTIKAEVLASLEMVGGRHYLARQAIENPPAYLSLLGKVIPQQVAETAGLVINVVQLESPAVPTRGVLSSPVAGDVWTEPQRKPLALVSEAPK